LNNLVLNGVEGDRAWDVVFDVAGAARWVIMPIGCPVLVVDEAMIASIPVELLDDRPVLVRSGADVKRAVEVA
jgi:hypothetical protein